MLSSIAERIETTDSVAPKGRRSGVCRVQESQDEDLAFRLGDARNAVAVTLPR